LLEVPGELLHVRREGCPATLPVLTDVMPISLERAPQSFSLCGMTFAFRPSAAGLSALTDGVQINSPGALQIS
jgi:hypothetical protein